MKKYLQLAVGLFVGGLIFGGIAWSQGTSLPNWIEGTIRDGDTGKLAIVDASGNLKVNVAAGGAAGGTSSSFSAAFPASGTAIGVKDSAGVNMVSLNADASGFLKVNCLTGCSAVTDIVASGSLVSATSVTSATLNAVSTAIVQVTGTWVATLQFEGTVDGTNYFALNAVPVGGGATVTSTTANGQWSINVAGLQLMRVRASTYTSGTIVITARNSSGVSGTYLANSLPTGSNVIGAVTQSGTWIVQPGNTANTTAWLVTGTGGTFPAAQSGTWTVQPGNTANTTPWLATISQGGNAATVSVGGALKVDGSAATQPVSGTITANAGTNLNTSALALDTSVNGILRAQGSATAGQSGPLDQGAVTTTAPVYTTGQTSPLSLTTAGALRVDTGTVTANQGGTWNINNVSGTVSLPTGAATAAKQPALGTAGVASADVITVQGVASMTALKVDGSAVTQPVSGTVTANLGTLNGAALDASVTGLQVAQGSTTAGQKGGLTLGAVTTTSPAYTTGQTSPISLDTSGLLRVNVVAGGGTGGTSSSFGAAFPGTGTAIGMKDSAGVNMVAFNADASGFLKVNCATGCAGGTFNNNADAVATSSTNGQAAAWLYGFNGTTWDRLQVDASKFLKVNCATGCAAGTFNNNSDAVATSATNGQSAAWLYGFNGTTWDRLQVDASKFLKVSVAAALPTGANTIGAVTQASGPWTVDLTKVGSVAVALGQTTMASSIPVTIASNQSALQVAQNGAWNVGQSGAWTQDLIKINGTTVLTGGVAGSLGVGGLAASGTAASGNPVPTGGVYNSAAITSLANGQAGATQVDYAGSTKVVPGIAFNNSLASWTSVTGVNTTATLLTNSGAPAVQVLLVQGSTITAGAITFEGSYDGTNFITVPAAQVVDPGTLAPIAIPYTLVASTNKPFLVLTGGFEQLRIKLSTAITGTATVTVSTATLPYQSINGGNLAQIAGTATDVNSGTKSAGTLRVVLATDQPQLTNKLLVTPDSVALPANQSVNVSQINGVTPLMGNGATGTGALRVSIASDSTGIVQPVGAATGGLTTSTLTAAATTNATNLKASAGTLYHVSGYNNSATLAWISFYNNAGTPTCGTSIVYQVMIPANSTSGGGAIDDIPLGLNFSTGIAYCVTTGIAGTGAVAANTYVVNFGYK